MSDALSEVALSSGRSSSCTDETELSTCKASVDFKEAESFVDLNPVHRPANDANIEEVANLIRTDPFAYYECAFGFQADLSEPVYIPKSKGAIRITITEEILAVSKIQGGLQSYCREISNGKHDFSSQFLESEIGAVKISVSQLDNVKEHLKAILGEIETAGHDAHDVHEDLRAAYSYAVPWIRRYRQIAVHCHVFYKVNYVLCAGY